MGCLSYVNTATRVTQCSSTFIDHIFGKFNDSLEVTPIVCDLDVTDYFSRLLLTDVSPDVINSSQEKIFIHKLNYPKLESFINHETWTEVYGEENLNLAKEKFVNEIELYINAITSKLKPKCGDSNLSNFMHDNRLLYINCIPHYAVDGQNTGKPINQRHSTIVRPKTDDLHCAGCDATLFAVQDIEKCSICKLFDYDFNARETVHYEI